MESTRTGVGIFHTLYSYTVWVSYDFDLNLEPGNIFYGYI